MTAMLHGYRRVDMTDDRNRSVRGFSCFFGYPSNGVVGQEVTKVFLSDDLVGPDFDPLVDVEYDLQFTPRGKISAVRMIDV